MRYLGEVVLLAAILVHCFNLSKSYSFTFGNCGFAGSKPIGIAFSDTSDCNATVCDLKCINGYYVEGGPLQCVNGTWSSLNNVYCEEECASNLSGIIDFVTANSSCASTTVSMSISRQAGYTPGSATCKLVHIMHHVFVIVTLWTILLIWILWFEPSLRRRFAVRSSELLNTHSNFRYGSFRWLLSIHVSIELQFISTGQVQCEWFFRWGRGALVLDCTEILRSKYRQQLRTVQN